MSETKLTPAQKRAIREARNCSGVGRVKNTTAEVLIRNGFATFERRWRSCAMTTFCLTPAGWTVEVGDE